MKKSLKSTVLAHNHWTIARLKDEFAGDICDTLNNKMKNFVSWRFAINESTNVKDMAKLAIFIRVDKELNKPKNFCHYSV